MNYQTRMYTPRLCEPAIPVQYLLQKMRNYTFRSYGLLIGTQNDVEKTEVFFI